MERHPESLCTVGLISINVLVFLILSFLGNTEDAVFMLMHGAMYEPYITQYHEYYRILTSIFLHFGIHHILNNMVMLGALGWNLEKEIGKVRLLCIYLLSGIGANVFSMWWNIMRGENHVSAGASGAVFGLMGALFYVAVLNKGRIGRLSGKGLLFMIALSLYFGFTTVGVDNAAHIGGLIFGFCLSVFLYRRPSHGEFDREDRSGFRR